MTALNDVRSFWENNPLWTGESSFTPGSIDFFEEHRSVYVADCFAGSFDLRFLPPPSTSWTNDASAGFGLRYRLLGQ